MQFLESTPRTRDRMVQTCPGGACSSAQIAAPERDAVSIEEIENLDRYLTTVLDAIAKLRSRESPPAPAAAAPAAIATIWRTASRRKK